MGHDLDAALVRTWTLRKHRLASVNLSTLTSYAGIVGNSHEEKHWVAPYGGMPVFTLRRYLSHSTLVKFLPRLRAHYPVDVPASSGFI